MQIAFYYGLAGLACAWCFRRKALTSVGKFLFLLAWPLLGAGFCIFIAAYSVPTFDLTTNVVGIGSIAIGIVPYLSNRSSMTRCSRWTARLGRSRKWSIRGP